MSDQRLLRIVCPNCQVTLKVAVRRIGEAHRCPSCRFRILIPDPELLEEARPLSSLPPPHAGSAAASESAPPSPLSDDELLAHLHRRRSSLRRDGLRGRAWLARVVVTLRNRVERIKLGREIRTLEDSLRPRLVDLGSQTVLEGRTGVQIDDSRARLREIVARLGESEDRLALLGGSTGAALLARDLRRRIAELEDDRDRVLEEIGRAAHRKRSGEPLDLRNIDVLQDMLNERHVRLEELGGTPDRREDEDTAGSSPRTRTLFRRALPISIVVIVVSLLAWMGYRYVMTTLLEPLTESRPDFRPRWESAVVGIPTSAGPDRHPAT